MPTPELAGLPSGLLFCSEAPGAALQVACMGPRRLTPHSAQPCSGPTQGLLLEIWLLWYVQTPVGRREEA